MRTTLDLPETLINEAMALTHLQTPCVKPLLLFNNYAYCLTNRLKYTYSHYSIK